MRKCLLCERPEVARQLCRGHYSKAYIDGTLSKYAVKDQRPLEERLLEKVVIGPGCWEWTGDKNGYGYAMIWRDGKRVRAHRVAFELYVGSLSNDEVVCHDCDNPGCIKPAHLFKGTRGDNNRDATKKGRRPSGERHHATRLTEEDVWNIRSSSMRVGDLARLYGVHQSHISKIRSRDARKLIP